MPCIAGDGLSFTFSPSNSKGPLDVAMCWRVSTSCCLSSHSRRRAPHRSALGILGFSLEPPTVALALALAEALTTDPRSS